MRGWQVKDKNDKVIGKVDNLLVNKSAERVVYLDVEVDPEILNKDFEPYSRNKSSDGPHNFINEDGENHLIIPIGLATLDLENEIVYSNEVDQKTYAETKRYSKGSEITRDYEVIIIETYDRSDENRNFEDDDSFYDNKHFERNY